MIIGARNFVLVLILLLFTALAQAFVETLNRADESWKSPTGSDGKRSSKKQ